MRVSEEQKMQILDEYNRCGVYAQVAKKHKVHPTTVKRLVQNSNLADKKENVRQQLLHKKEIARYMEETKETVCHLIGIYLKELMSEDRLKKAPINQIASAMGTVIDKFIKHEDGKGEECGGVVILPQVKEDGGDCHEE